MQRAKTVAEANDNQESLSKKVVIKSPKIPLLTVGYIKKLSRSLKSASRNSIAKEMNIKINSLLSTIFR